MLKENGEFNFSEEIVFEAKELSAESLAIHENAVLRAKKYLVAEADLLAAIIEVDKDQTFLKFGETHLTPYCEKHLGLSEHIAPIFVRVARKSREVPELQKAVEDGLSVTKAKTIVSVVTEENCGEWIEKANSLSKEKLEKEVVKENPQVAKKEKSKPVGENRNRVEFELNDEVFALQNRAVDIVSAKFGRSATLAEVQAMLLEVFLKQHDPVKKAERAKKKAAPRQKNQHDRSRDRSRAKSIPAAVKHQVNLRDKGKCQATHPDGTMCGKTRWVHLHHLKPKAEGGEDIPENLITLCSAHHWMWHRSHPS